MQKGPRRSGKGGRKKGSKHRKSKRMDRAKDRVRTLTDLRQLGQELFARRGWIGEKEQQLFRLLFGEKGSNRSNILMNEMFKLDRELLRLFAKHDPNKGTRETAHKLLKEIP